MSANNSKEEAIHTFKNAGITYPEFSLAGQKLWARCISIYDADTVTVIMPFAGTFYKFPIRVNGIDACEIKSKNVENKQMALRARNRMFSLVTGQEWTGPENATKAQLEAILKKDVYLVWVECDALDKYGRVLATLRGSPGDISFADILISEKYAYAYGGATKLTEDDQVKMLGGQ